MASSESRGEPPGVAKDSDTSNTIVRTRVPIDPEAFPPAIEKSGTENERNIPKGVPENAGAVDLFEFPSEEKGSRSQAADPPKTPAPSMPNVARRSILVTEPSAPSVKRDETLRRIGAPEPTIEHRREPGKSDRRMPVPAALLERTRPVWRAIRDRIPTALVPFVCGVAVGATTIILLLALVPSVMPFAGGFGGAVSPPAETQSSTATAAPPAIAPTAAAVVPSVNAPAAKQEVRPGSGEPRRTAAAGAAAIQPNRAAAVGRATSEPSRAAATARVPSELTRAQATVPSGQPAVTPRPAPASGQFRGSLAVSSSPPGAQVFVNGAPVGVTPLLLRSLPVGSRAVRVELNGHERWSAAVRIVADERTVIAAKLQRSSTP